jgi:hypothetical protein
VFQYGVTTKLISYRKPAPVAYGSGGDGGNAGGANDDDDGGGDGDAMEGTLIQC